MTAKAKRLARQSLDCCSSYALSLTGPAQIMRTFPSYFSRVLTVINSSALSNGQSLGSCESCAGSLILMEIRVHPWKALL